MRASIMGYCDMCFEFASPIAAFWLVGAREKHKERLGKFDGRIVRVARRVDRSSSSPVGSFGKFARQIVWKARRVDRLGSLPSGPSKSSPSGLLGRATEGHCRLAGLIWQKTPPGGLVARLGFWVLQGNTR